MREAADIRSDRTAVVIALLLVVGAAAILLVINQQSDVDPANRPDFVPIGARNVNLGPAIDDVELLLTFDIDQQRLADLSSFHRIEGSDQYVAFGDNARLACIFEVVDAKLADGRNAASWCIDIAGNVERLGVFARGGTDETSILAIGYLPPEAAVAVLTDGSRYQVSDLGFFAFTNVADGVGITIFDANGREVHLD